MPSIHFPGLVDATSLTSLSPITFHCPSFMVSSTLTWAAASQASTVLDPAKIKQSRTPVTLYQVMLLLSCNKKQLQNLGGVQHRGLFLAYSTYSSLVGCTHHFLQNGNIPNLFLLFDSLIELLIQYRIIDSRKISFFSSTVLLPRSKGSQVFKSSKLSSLISFNGDQLV